MRIMEKAYAKGWTKPEENRRKAEARQQVSKLASQQNTVSERAVSGTDANRFFADRF
jgi:hypothetical protein